MRIQYFLALPCLLATITPVQPAEQAFAQPSCDCIVVPALTSVVVEIEAAVGSKVSKTGDSFPIRLAAPILVDGQPVIAAGATGMGEVVHAKGSGGSGVGGELVLAARYLDVAGKRLRLRSMRVSSVGKDQTGLAMASSYALGPFAFAIQGKDTEIAAGRLAEAKTAEAFEVSRPAAAPAPDAAVSPAPDAPG